MCRNTIVYWQGNIGVHGKGPTWSESYAPNRTIGQLIESMSAPQYRLCESGRRIEIFKHERGNMNRYDGDDPYWAHDTKLSDYQNAMGSCGSDAVLIYCLV